MLLLFLVAVLVPKNVLTQYRFLQDYVAATGAFIPGVERLAAVSSFPEVTRLVVSLLWTFVPIFIAVYCFHVRVPDSFLARLRQRPFFLSFGFVVIAISTVLLAVMHDMTPRDLEGGRISRSVLRAISTSRGGLGLIAGFFSAAVAMMVYMVLIWLLSLPRLWTRGVGALSMAAVVLLAAGKWGLREASAQSEMGYATSLSDVPVRLMIGDITFLIPKNFIWSRANWRGGKTDGVNLHALLPGFEPYTASNRAEFEKPGWNRKIAWVIGEHSTPRHPAPRSRELVFTRVMKGVRFREADGPHGLRRLVMEGKTPAVPREHFIGKLRDGGFYYANCSPDQAVRFPSCQTTVEYSNHVYVQYSFAKRLLNDWQAIDTGILALVKRFEAKRERGGGTRIEDYGQRN